jgi:hypothetical protein
MSLIVSATMKSTMFTRLHDCEIPNSIKNAISRVAAHEQVKARIADSGKTFSHDSNFRLFTIFYFKKEIISILPRY